MKRLLALLVALLCALPLTACSRDMNWVISNEPSVWGVIEKIEEDHVLIRVTKADDAQINQGGVVRAEKATRLKDCSFSQRVGDEVAVYYDSNTPVTYGVMPEIRDVHGYCLITPIERETE